MGFSEWAFPRFKAIVQTLSVFVTAIVAASLLASASIWETTIEQSIGQTLGFGIIATIFLLWIGFWITDRDEYYGIATSIPAIARNAVSFIRIKTPDIEEAKWIGIGTIILTAFSFGFLSIASSLGYEASGHTFTDNGSLLVYLLLSSFILVPVEEYLFRGVLQQFLRTQLRSVSSIGVTAVLFGVIHLGSIEAGALAYTGLMIFHGIAYGTAYERTENLLTPIGMHVLYNGIVLLSVLV